MGKVFKYIGWSFLAIVILIAGIIGYLLATGAFKDEDVYLNSITFDSDSLLSDDNINSTTLSKINDVIVANDSFNMTINFAPENATAKELSLSVLKGSEIVSIPKTVNAGVPFKVEILKERKVTVGSVTYYVLNNALYNSEYQLVTNVDYAVYNDINVVRVGENYYKINEYNVGGEVRIRAVDSVGGTTWTQFEFFVDSGITGLNLDFTSVPGELQNNVIVFNEDDLTFTLSTTPSHAINPSTGEIYTDKFQLKNIFTESSNENVIKITKTENLQNKTIRYTFKTLEAGQATITSKVLPTYQMYLDYIEADTIFNTDVSEGFMAVTNFANKYANYLKTCGNPVVNGTNVSTQGNEWYKGKLVDGRLVINTEAAYEELLNLMFVTVKQDIVVENVELTSFRLGKKDQVLNLFDTLKYNGQELTRENLTKLFDIKLESTSQNISNDALNVRLNDLKLYSIKQGRIFNSPQEIIGEDLLKVKEFVGGQWVDKIFYTEFTAEDNTTKYLTYQTNNSVLEVLNPTSNTNRIWKVTANKEQENDNDGTGILFELFDEINNTYFRDIANVKINKNDIQTFSLNQDLIHDMSINTTNNYGLPKFQYVDLSLENVGKPGSLIKEFTENASYSNFKLFVKADTAQINGYLKIRVKTVDGTLTGNPMEYTLTNSAGQTFKVFEVDYKNDSSGRICIEALNTSIVYTMEDNNPLNPTSKYTENDVELYVAVVRTNVNGEPIDSDGNLVDEKYATEGSNWEYRNKYDIIKVASESITFNIYSYIQDLKFYTANENGTADFIDRTTVDGVIKQPIKMIVGQRFELFVTNLDLNSTGGFNGNPNERTNLNTALFDYWFNNVKGGGSATFATTNEYSAKVHESIEMVNGKIKITIECLDSITSLDVYPAGITHLESCRANIQISYAQVAKDGSNNPSVFARYSAGASENLTINNNSTVTVKGSLSGNNLIWQYFDTTENTNKGEFVFGGKNKNSIDFNLDLNLDDAYTYKNDTINEDIKNNAKYNWRSSNEEYVTISERAGDNYGYNPIISILQGTPEGMNVVITCDVYLYEAAIDSSDAKYNGTKFTFRFVLKVIQSEVVVSGYSINNDNVWIENKGTSTSQKIVGGNSFDILASHSASDEIGGTTIERNPITATLDGANIVSSLTFTIETYYSSDNKNQGKQAIYFLKDGVPTYTISGLTAISGEYSLNVYAKDSLISVDAAIKVSTFNSDKINFIYYITVTPNLELEENLPTGKNYIETTLGAYDEATNSSLVYSLYQEGENEAEFVTGKTLDDYYTLMKGTTEIKLQYSIPQSNAYGEIVDGNRFVPKGVSPTKNHETVNVLIQYDVTFSGVTETYTYNTISVRVLPYYNNIVFTSSVFEVDAGVEYNLFTGKYKVSNDEYAEGAKLFNVTTKYGDGEVEDLSRILRIQISENESESKLRAVFGDAGYNTLIQNNRYITNGILSTSSSLITDQTLHINVYYVEYEGKLVEITNSTENLLQLKINKTIKYETDYLTQDSALAIEKDYDLNVNSSNNALELTYNSTILNVYDYNNLENNLLTLTGGTGVDVFNSIIKNVILSKLTNGYYTLYEGNSVKLNTNYILDADSTRLYNKVEINYENSVNEIEYYKITFVSISDEQYEFYFKLLPNITISTFYPINNNSENVLRQTVVDLESNYIKQNNRVELSYNGVILNARVISSDSTNNNFVLSIDKESLIESGFVSGLTGIDDFEDRVNVVVNNKTKMFTYEVTEGGINVDTGMLNGSVITFNLKDSSVTSTVVKVTAFNGANTYYNFAVNSELSQYRPSVKEDAFVRADNEFNLNEFINSCGSSAVVGNNFNALRIIVTNFNGTVLNILDGTNEDGSKIFRPVEIYELIPYNAVLKFNNVGTEKNIILYMYTTTSVEGDKIVELKLTVKPNAIISTNKDSSGSDILVIPAGTELDIANSEKSPLSITYGDTSKTNIPINAVSYKLVQENGTELTDTEIANSGITLNNTLDKITCENINTNKVIYLEITVDFTDNGTDICCSYVEIRKITFVPNVKIVFDYETGSVALNYRTQTAAPITKTDNVLKNSESIALWDNENNASSYPIYITDFYGENLVQNSELKISFRNDSAVDVENIIESVNSETGATMYSATNHANVPAAINVIITWGSGSNAVSYIKPYNIRFQPNVAQTNGVVVNYVTENGAQTTVKQKLSVYGGSSIDFGANNANYSFATTDGKILEQTFTNGGNTVSNNVSVTVNNVSGVETIAYLRFTASDNDLYTLTSEGIKFKAVSDTTEVRIPFVLNLVYSNYGDSAGGVFNANENTGFYETSRGEIVVEVLKVITAVSTKYNRENPYSVIVLSENSNKINVYNLLNITLDPNTVLSNATDKSGRVIIDTTALSKLFTITVDSDYAIISGEEVICNIHSTSVSELEVKFTIEGISEPISAFITLVSNASINAIDPLKTFKYENETYYIDLDNKVYNYKMEQVGTGSLNGDKITFNGEELDVENVTTNGLKNVLGIYVADGSTIDLNELVEYKSHNSKIIYNGKTLYVLNTRTSKKLVTADGKEFTEAIYEFVNNGAEVSINGTNYTIIEGDQFNIDKTGTNYLIASTSTATSNMYSLKGNLLTIYPNYSTDVANNTLVYSFEVTTNSNLKTDITFLCIPVETKWEMSFNGTKKESGETLNALNEAELIGENNATGNFILTANYGSTSGSLHASDYKFNLITVSSFIRMEENVLIVDYSKFVVDTIIEISVQATFEGMTVSSSYEITIEPILKLFAEPNINYQPNPARKSSDAIQRVLIKSTDLERGLVSTNVDLKESVTENTSGFTISLTNDEDSKYVEIDYVNGQIIIKDSLFLLENKIINFNVVYCNSINGTYYTFTTTATLNLNLNTQLMNIFETRTLSVEKDISGRFKNGSVVINTGSPIGVYSVPATEGEDPISYASELNISVTVVNSVAAPDDLSNIPVTASISNGLITISYEMRDGKYPSKIDITSFKITITNNSGDVVYENDKITISLV